MSSRSSGRASEGDWQCSDPKCGNMNFARRTHCNRCGKGSRFDNTESEPSSSADKRKVLGAEIGKLAAEKSRGLFSAEDWQCGNSKYIKERS